MKKSIYSTTLIIGALFLASPVFAVPMQYEINFNGAIPGTGSFVWDSDTQLMSNMTWNIGSYSGGVDDATFSWDAEVFGGNQSQFLFEILTLEDVHPVDCSGTSSCGILPSALYGDFDEAFFTVSTDNLRRYSFMIDGQFAASGTWTTQLVGLAESVPAPASIILMGLGLVGLSFSRRKKV